MIFAKPGEPPLRQAIQANQGGHRSSFTASLSLGHRGAAKQGILNFQINRRFIQSLQARLDRLKMETGQELVNAEIAVRTRDTPTSMQYENTAPTEYFQRYTAKMNFQIVRYVFLF